MGKKEKAEKKAEKKAKVEKNVESPPVYEKIPFYPFTYVAKDINGNVLGKYYVQFKIRIIKHKFVEYVVELFPLYSTNVITEFSFTVKRTKDNIEKNAKRLFNLDKSGYPGRDGQTFNNEVSKVILGLFNNQSSQKEGSRPVDFPTSVEIETTSSTQPGDSIIDGNASYTIVTLPTSTSPNGTCFLYDMVQGVSSFSIPSSIIYQGVTYTVVSIGTPGSIYICFADVKSLTSVSIPTSVTYIAVSAFYNCSDLTTLGIPSGSLLQNIDAYAFQGAHLTYVGNNDDGYNSFQNCTQLTNIGTYAFYDLWLENFITNSTVSSGCTIGDYAFYNCNFIGTGGLSGFNTLKLGGVVSIGANAFGMSSNNVNAFTTVLLDPITVSIGSSAFFNCLSIASLVIPENSQLQTIGDDSFNNNKSNPGFGLTYIGTGPSNWNSFSNCTLLNNIGSSAFYDLWLTTLAFNSVLTLTIGNDAFYKCNYITSINFIGDNNNDNIIINSSAFAECVILNEVTILPTTQFFASNAFSGCSALQNSSVNGTINTSAIPNQISNYFSVANGFYVNFNIIP
jgi:hypothetical protein